MKKKKNKKDSLKTAELPRPFIKWAGGKTSILNHIIKHVKDLDLSNGYHEPFIGGGAVFFEFYKKEWLKGPVFLSDRNEALVAAFNAIKHQPEEIICKLREHAAKHSKEYYYSIRSNHNPCGPIEIAARFLYLNKTCFNGLYRENSKGEFNVPIGSYKNPKILDEDNIMAVSKAFQTVDIRNQDFESINPAPGSFVYFDPPYYPEKTTSFTKYSKFDFRDDDHVRLNNLLIRLQENNVYWMLSNSNTTFIRNLYGAPSAASKVKRRNVSSIDERWTIHKITAPRYIQAKGSGKKISELLITNYESKQK